MELLSFLHWTMTFPLFATIFLFITLAMAKTCPKNLPPGPSRLPVLGNLLKLLSTTAKPHKYLAELARVHGPIMTLQLGSVTTIVISSSTLAKQVLLKNHLVFSSPFVLDGVRAHQHDQFSVAWLSIMSSHWMSLRKIYSNRLFSDKMLKAMQIRRHEKVEKMLGYLGECSRVGLAIDVGQLVYDTIFNIMSNTIFSMDFAGDERMGEIRELMDRIIQEIGRPNIVDCYPFLSVIDPQQVRQRLTKSCVKLFKLFDEIIDMRLKSKDDQVNSSGSYNDLLDVLMEVMEEQMDGISRDHVLHLLLDTFGSSVDTTSKTIEWAMAELLSNPQALSKSQEEIDMVVGKGKAVQESDICNLPFLQAVVKETLRLHPAAPLLLPRKVEQNIDIGGYTVPRGAQVLVNAWAIGRDPNVWPDPDTFSPERFMDTDFDVKGQHFDLIPFGAGRRICPGLPLALRVVPLMLASLISSHNWKLEDDDAGNLGVDMDDKYALTVKKAKPLRAVPFTR